MRAVVQRVIKSNVEVDNEIISSIDNGLMVLVGICDTDTQKDLEYIANKIINLRIFDDEEGIMNLSLVDKNYELLLVSQFTLYADGRKGNRPSYIRASKAEFASVMFNKLVEYICNKNIKVKTGKFQADMKVSLINDGPVTILLDSNKEF